MSAYDPTGVEHHTIPTFAFKDGTVLHDLKVAYRQYNTSAATTNGTVLIPTCFSGWINTTLTFTSTPTGDPLSLSSYHVVVVAMLGNGESSSPSNKPFFPEPGSLHYEDVINSQHHLLTHGLGVTHLEAVIGFSMGGQQAYHWATMYPIFVSRIVPICTSARTSPHNYAFLEGPISALECSIDYVAWREIKAKAARGEPIGENLAQVKPKRGLIAFGRAYCAWIFSAEWFRAGHWRTASPQTFTALEDYIQAHGTNKLAWDADDLLVLARMWQMGDISKTAQGQTTRLGFSDQDDTAFQSTLQNITCPVLLMPCRTDQYFRPEDNEFEAQHLPKGTVSVIESIWGHGAGGGMNPDDVKFMDTEIARFLKET